MASFRAWALYKILTSQQNAQKQKAQEQNNQKSAAAANQYYKSYSSQEFAGQADQGSDFFNQARQRGTLFGN